jgi:hypothetical protein
MGKLIWIVIACIVALGGAWAVASYKLGDKVAQFEQGLQKIGPERGGRLPTEESVENRVQEQALQLGLQIDDLVVSIAPLGKGNIDRAGMATQMVQDKLDEVNRSRELGTPVQETEGSKVAPELYGPKKLALQGVLIEVNARVRAKKWLWSINEPVSATITVH